MNVYDFDKTIFYPDSSFTFCRWCYKKYPALALRLAPKAAARGIGAALKLCSTARLKEALFGFLKSAPDADALVREFWETHWDGIGRWYLDQKKPDDIIISASPEFLVRPAAERLGVRLIATPMDKTSGRIIGANCHDSEKVRRFYLEYPDAHVDEFYSDSLHDTPMARLADRAFMVKKERLSPWPWKE